MSKNHVILDCDGGSDDAWALILLLKAHEKGLINLLGITISGNGNTDLRSAATNMFRILKACGYKKIPLYLGAEESLLGQEQIDRASMFHGHDGFGDILPPDESIDFERDAQKTHAVIAIKEYIDKYPKDVSIICVGPCTNVALCYSMFGSECSRKIRELFIMGGNIRGVGNMSRSAEFNFYVDPEAANAILSKSKCPITILPWETCLEDAFLIPMKWRLENLVVAGSQKHPVLDILDPVEFTQYSNYGFVNWNPCDAFLVGVFLFKKRFSLTESSWHAVVDLKGDYTRGQMVLDHLKDEQRNPKNVKVIELMDEEFFKRTVQWSLGYVDDLDY